MMIKAGTILHGQLKHYRSTLSMPCCILLMMLSGPSLAQDFGTLFTTPEEREYLDYLRDELVRRNELATFNIIEDVIPEIPAEVVEEQAAPQITEYNFGGIMERRNGSRMVWLNGRQILEDDLPSNMSITDTSTGTQLRIRANDTNYLLKPGEAVNIRSGATQNSTQQGAGNSTGQTGTPPVAEDVPETSAATPTPESINDGNADNLIVIDEEFLKVIDLENATPQQAALIQALLEARESENDNAQP